MAPGVSVRTLSPVGYRSASSLGAGTGVLVRLLVPVLELPHVMVV